MVHIRQHPAVKGRGDGRVQIIPYQKNLAAFSAELSARIAQNAAFSPHLHIGNFHFSSRFARESTKHGHADSIGNFSHLRENISSILRRQTESPRRSIAQTRRKSWKTASREFRQSELVKQHDLNGEGNDTRPSPSDPFGPTESAHQHLSLRSSPLGLFSSAGLKWANVNAAL